MLQLIPAALKAAPTAGRIAKFILPMLLSMWGRGKASDPDAGKMMQAIGTLAHLGGGIGAGHSLSKGAGKGMAALGFGAKAAHPSNAAINAALHASKMARGKPARRVLDFMKNKAAPGLVTNTAQFAPFLAPDILHMANQPDVGTMMESMPMYPGGGGGQSQELAMLRQLMGGEPDGLRDQNIDLFNMLTGRDLIQ